MRLNHPASFIKMPQVGLSQMKGIWFWPVERKAQARVLRKIREEDELPAILNALAKNKDGLSNAQLDEALSNNSQWRTLWHLRELMALGFIEYNVQFFGDPGRYMLTDLGRKVLPRLTQRPNQTVASLH